MPLITNLTTNLLAFDFVQWDEAQEEISSVSQTGYIQPGQTVAMTCPFAQDLARLCECAVWDLEGTWYETSVDLQDTTSDYVLMPSEYGSQAYAFPRPASVSVTVGDAPGTYLAARYQVVALFMLLGAVLVLCYQAGRKASR